MDVRPAAGAPGLRGEAKLFFTDIFLYQFQDKESKEVDIDLDEVLDIEDEIQRKIFVRVIILYPNHHLLTIVLENSDRLKVIQRNH